MSKNITLRDLISIRKAAFGIKEVSSNLKRKLPGSNVPAQKLGETFSISKMSQLNKIENDNKYFIQAKCKTPEGKQFYLDLNKAMIDPIREKLQKIERAKKPIKYTDTLDVAKAKQFPIDNLLIFRYRTAKCIWHLDSKPSLYYYKKENRVHCFVCNQGWDSIDVYQKLNNCSFKEAVLKLQ